VTENLASNLLQEKIMLDEKGLFPDVTFKALIAPGEEGREHWVVRLRQKLPSFMGQKEQRSPDFPVSSDPCTVYAALKWESAYPSKVPSLQLSSDLRLRFGEVLEGGIKPTELVVKGRINLHHKRGTIGSRVAIEGRRHIANFPGRHQDLRVTLGYDVGWGSVYAQFRENNVTLNTDLKGRWTLWYEL
jgi:hypothetical protein